MARSLEQLQKQYNHKAKDGRRAGSPMGGPRRHGPGGGHGKPKNAKAVIARIWKYVAAYKFRLLFVLLCMLCSTLTSLFGGYLLAPIINRLTLVVMPNAADKMALSVAERLADGVIESLTSPFIALFDGKMYGEVLTYIFTALIILGAIYLVGIVATYLQARIMLSVSQSATARIRADLFDKMQDLPVKYFDAHPTGELMSRYTNDIDNIDVMLNNSLTSIVSGVITLVGTFTFMLTTSLVLTAVTVFFIPLFLFLGGAIGKRSARYYSGQQAALGAVNGYMEETITGQRVVKVFGHEDTCVKEFSLLNRDLRGKQMHAQFWGGVMGPIMGNTSQISYGVTVGLGGILMLTTGFTPGALTVFAGYSRHFSMPINMLSHQVSTFFAALAGAERVFGVIDEVPEEPDAKDAVSAKNLRGDVIFENVSFGYTPEKLVLRHISLYARPGQKIAFVGSTGAGKTTVTNLLSRFYDTADGLITIDGVPLEKYRRNELRSSIAMVLQDTHLFTGTVMENIRYGRPDATDEEVIAAAKTASAHSFILRLSEGYNTMLSGDGANLSGGQRQLLSIARAALSRAPVLVLDEATSSVDTRTERHIEHGMDRLMKNRTTFVIAHRLSTVRNADVILVLEAGEIIERGTHEQLLALGGRYYELYTGKRELA